MRAARSVGTEVLRSAPLVADPANDPTNGTLGTGCRSDVQTASKPSLRWFPGSYATR